MLSSRSNGRLELAGGWGAKPVTVHKQGIRVSDDLQLFAHGFPEPKYFLLPPG